VIQDTLGAARNPRIGIGECQTLQPVNSRYQYEL